MVEGVESGAMPVRASELTGTDAGRTGEPPRGRPADGRSAPAEQRGAGEARTRELNREEAAGPRESSQRGNSGAQGRTRAESANPSGSAPIRFDASGNQRADAMHDGRPGASRESQGNGLPDDAARVLGGDAARASGAAAQGAQGTDGDNDGRANGESQRGPGESGNGESEQARRSGRQAAEGERQDRNGEEEERDGSESPGGPRKVPTDPFDPTSERVPLGEAMLKAAEKVTEAPDPNGPLDGEDKTLGEKLLAEIQEYRQAGERGEGRTPRPNAVSLVA